MIRVFRPYERIPIVYEPDSSFAVTHVTAVQNDDGEVPYYVLTQRDSLIAHYEDLLRIDGILDGVCQKKSWLVRSTVIPEGFSTVEINNVTDYPRHREYLRNKRVRHISNGDILAHTRQPSELTISNLITSVFE